MRPTAGARSRQSVSRNVRLHVIVGRAGDDGAVAVRQVERPLIRLAVPRSTPGIARAPRNSNSWPPANGPRTASRTETAPGIRSEPARCRLRRRSSLGAVGEHLADRVVELAHAAEAGGERDVGHRQVGRLDQDPSGLGTLRPGERERPGAELVGQQPVEVALL